MKVYNLDYINDIMKEFQIRVKDGSKTTSDSMDQMSASTQKVWEEFLKGNGTVAEVANTVVAELQTMDDQVAANQIAVGLFGTKFEDLESTAVYAMLGTQEGLTNVEGAMNRLNEAQEQTFGQRWESFTRTAAASLEPLGKILLDLAEQWLPKIITAVEGVAKWFADLTPTMQGVTVGIGAIAAAIGPLIMIVGSLISSIGGIVGLFTSGGAAAGAFSAVIAAMTGPVGIVIGVITAFAAGVALLYAKWDEFKNLSPVLQGAITALFAPIVAVTGAIKTIQDAFSPAVEGVKSFGNAVSQETSEAVLSFLDLSDQATVAFNQMNWSGQAITQDMADKITEIYRNMGSQVLAEMQTDHAEQLTELQNFYAQSSVLSDQQEAEALTKAQTYQANRQQVITDGMARINEITSTAATERRELTLAEEAEINRIHEQMKEAAITHMSESAEEQKVILEALKNEASEITATQAAEVVKNSVKQKDETVAEAQKQYEESLKIIMEQRDELGVISEEQAELLITEAKRQRDKTIESAEEMHKNVVSEAKDQAEEHVDKVDWTTGELKSKWQVMKDDTITKMKETGAAIKRDWTDAYNDTVKRAGDIVASVGKFFSDKVNTVETKMAEVKQKIESKWGEVTAFLKGIDLIQIGKDIVNGLIEGIGKKFDGVKKKVEELAGLIPDWAKDILGIRSPSRVMMEVGYWTVEGLIQGIQNGKGKAGAVTAEMAKEIVATFEKYGRIDTSKLLNISDDKEMLELASLYNQLESFAERVNGITIDSINEKFELDKKELVKNQAYYISRLKQLEGIEGEMTDAQFARAREKYKHHFTEEYNLYEEKSKAIKEIQQGELTLLAANQKEKFETEKKFIEQAKKLNVLSYKDEVELYNDFAALYSKDSEEYKYYESSKEAAKKEVTEKLLNINNDYTAKIQAANQKLINDEKALNDEYNKVFNDRVNSIIGSMNPFDEFNKKTEVSGQQLINNLESQINAINEYGDVMASLSGRIQDESLLDYLSSLGTGSLGELQALNSLSDAELSKYAELYNERFNAAKNLATDELVGLREETDAQILLLREETAKQLDVYQTEWATAINEITGNVTKQFDTLPGEMQQTGVDIISGIQSGLSQMTPSLLMQAQAIADAIKSTISSALDINSPSRVMRGFGINIGEGLVQGMDNMVAKVAQSSARLSNAVQSAHASLASSANRSASVMAPASSSSSSVDNSKHFNPSVVIHTTDSGAKEMHRVLRKMAFSF